MSTNEKLVAEKGLAVEEEKMVVDKDLEVVEEFYDILSTYACTILDYDSYCEIRLEGRHKVENNWHEHSITVNNPFNMREIIRELWGVYEDFSPFSEAAEFLSLSGDFSLEEIDFFLDASVEEVKEEDMEIYRVICAVYDDTSDYMDTMYETILSLDEHYEKHMDTYDPGELKEKYDIMSMIPSYR